MEKSIIHWVKLPNRIEIDLNNLFLMIFLSKTEMKAVPNTWNSAKKSRCEGLFSVQ